MSRTFEFLHFFQTEDLHILVVALAFIVALIIVYGIYDITKKVFNNYKNAITTIKAGLNKQSFKNLITFWVLQKRVIKTLRGGFHLFLYIGIIILFAGTVIRAFDYYFYQGLISGYVYVVFKLFMNIGGIFTLIGSLFFISVRSISHPKELTYTWADWLFILGLLYIVITGFILSGIVSISSGRPVWVDPVGNFFGAIVSPLFKNTAELVTFYRILWLSHLILALFLIILILWTKIGHWFFAFFNIILSRTKVSTVKPIINVKELVEKGEDFGVIKLNDFSWKQKLDFLSCTFCGRCDTKCPALISGKPLSPANLIQTLRKHTIKGKTETIGSLIDPDVIWSCTTCGACVSECPVLIHHVESIVDVRRGFVSKSENVPEQALTTLNNVMRSGNPFGLSYYDRDEWLEEVINQYGIEYAEEGKEYDHIYWIGCVISFDPVQRQHAEALISVLKKSNFKVAVLKEEICCGEPIRKISDEFTFQTHYDRTVQMLKNLKFKCLITSCPHCYTTFKNDYSALGYHVNIKHYVQVISELLKDGKIKINKRVEESITYHDPCNLARWNNIYEEPREIIQKIAKDFREMKRIKSNTFCCGAGGGQLFYQIDIGERISKIRSEEASKTGAKTLIVSCPFCYSMLKGDSEERGLEMKDLAKLVLPHL